MKSIAIILVAVISGCAVQDQNISQSQPVFDVNTPDYHVSEGYQSLSNRKTTEAIAAFDSAINLCDSQYDGDKRSIYASRGPAETLYYMIKAAAEKKDAVAVSPTCADALYLKGYALLELGDVGQAEELLLRAIAMSPVNSMYLSELGHIYHKRKLWQKALDIFERSEEAADSFSPDTLKDQELARAKRGVGFSLIELGRLDDAEEKFRECLVINADDFGAKNELKYIKQLKARKDLSGA